MMPVLLDASLPATLTGVVTDLFGVTGDVVSTVTGNAVMCIGIAAMVGGREASRRTGIIKLYPLST